MSADVATLRPDRARGEVGTAVVQHNAEATRSSRWARCAVVLFLPACFHPSFEHPRCGPQGECPGGLTCSVQGFCEQPGLAVDAAIDAAIDAPGMAPDAMSPTCYGPSGWQVCLAARASGAVQLQGALDTGASNKCLPSLPTSWTASQPDACIIVGDTVTVTSLSVTGTRPLVLVAQTRINVTTLLDVASHRATGTVGAGTGTAGDCKPFAGSPGNGPPGGGGAGGSFVFPGGRGGTGDGTTQPGGQAATGLVGAPSRLRGGCAGQPGGGGAAGDVGAGGGAIYLVSAGTIAISGIIDVSGAGGGGEAAQHGGGGGGSGGMIALYALSLTTTATSILIADGGGGGGGSAQSGSMMRGQDGHEPNLAMPLSPALGGTGGILIGFNGGDGGNGYPALATTIPGLSGVSGDTGAGGGGGGGGGGHIRANQSLGSAAVSPPPVAWP